MNILGQIEVQPKTPTKTIEEAKGESPATNYPEWYQKVFEEIDALGKPVKSGGRLDFDYYKKLFAIITKHTRAHLADDKKEKLTKRREYLKYNEQKEYAKIVTELMGKEEQTVSALLDATMQHIDVSEIDFMLTQQYFMVNPESQQELMMAAAGSDSGEPKISFEKTKQIFLEQEDRRVESMSELMEKANLNPPMTPYAQMEQMMEAMMGNAKLADFMYEKYGVEEDELAQAIMHYKLTEDSDCQAKLHEVMMKLSPY